MSSKMRDEITYPFPNVNGTTVEVWDEVTFPFPNFNGTNVEVWDG